MASCCSPFLLFHERSESHDKQDGVAVGHCSDAALSLCADQVNVAGLLVFVFFCSMILYGLRITARSGIEFHQTTP
jgi:hypothetical protein